MKKRTVTMLVVTCATIFATGNVVMASGQRDVASAELSTAQFATSRLTTNATTKSPVLGTKILKWLGILEETPAPTLTPTPIEIKNTPVPQTPFPERPISANEKPSVSQDSVSDSNADLVPSSPELPDEESVEMPYPPVDYSEANVFKDPLSFPTESSNMVWSDDNETYRFCSRICQINEDGNILKTIRPDEPVLLKPDARYCVEFYFQNLSDKETIKNLSFRVENIDLPRNVELKRASDAETIFVSDRNIDNYWMFIEKNGERFSSVNYVLYSKPEIPLKLQSEGDESYELASELAETKDLSIKKVGSAEGEAIGDLTPGEIIRISKTWKVSIDKKEIRRRLKKLQEYEKTEASVLSSNQ